MAVMLMASSVSMLVTHHPCDDGDDCDDDDCSCHCVTLVSCCFLYVYYTKRLVSCQALVFELLVPDSADVLFFANVVDHVSIVWDLWCVWDGLGD